MFVRWENMAANRLENHQIEFSIREFKTEVDVVHLIDKITYNKCIEHTKDLMIFF